ncbi:hypothetical protein ETB97_006431 [Aspergillus alliaceus]|uniref:HEAT repeat protein n=1 Tax=Petromyces alliaceus TaxID=209559 RepID=A0A8H5ZXD2_PETAA|nr:hypothetical protein ETB97_006431 [Aspergillus burnettii]
MEYSRQEAFKKLRGPCVELSSVGLSYRGHQSSSNDVFRVLQPVHDVLNELSSKGALDEKLAEYAFFPLSHIFNETQRVPANCLELAVNCLRILIANGWRERLSPQMGKQLMILLTLIVGGPPSMALGNQQTQTKPAELSIAGFDCLSAIFDVMEGPVAQRTIYNEIGTATVVDQTVYVLLEGIADSTSDDLCVSAAKALQALYCRITDRVVLASIMPRTVSTLTKVIKPTIQVRRSYKLLSACVKVLTHMIEMVLNDQVASIAEEKPTQTQKSDDGLALDESWLRATATQIKLALANIIQVRRHDRPEVQAALLDLCSMVVEDCRSTLQESLPLVVETMVVLSDTGDDQSPNNAYSTLMHLATTYTEVLDSLKNSLHAWITAFPRTMQSNDETSKQWALKQISTAFHILSQIQSGSDILTTGLASGLCDSVFAAINHSTNALQPLNPETSSQTLEVLHHGHQSEPFPPVILEHRSQQQTLKDLQSMIFKLNSSGSGSDITRLVINRVHQETGNSMIAPFWLALECLKSGAQLTTFDEFISSDLIDPASLYSTRANMIEELYYISLPILSESLPDESKDWRISALALEVVALQAQQLNKSFRPELMEALYPVLQLLSSPNQNLQRHAMICLNLLTEACAYENTSIMIIENVDYLVNSVALKLNTFDVSPYPPQVLFMMVKLCGVRLIPYLDDLVDSIFGILDMYHGYPKLVEMMFKTLTAIVEEGTKSPAFLAIDDGKDSERVGHRKKQYKRLQISTLAEDLANRRAKRAKHMDEFPEADEHVSHPERPWTTKPDKPTEPEEDIDALLKKVEAESDEPLPPPDEPDDQEKPLSKPHNLLLHIIQSIPSHLSSPSPYLRRSLLSILIQVSPILSGHENSFLPIINEVWPSVAARISFPSPFNSSSSSTALMTGETPQSSIKTLQNRPDDEFAFQEEIYVTTTACLAVESMCKSTGDFMATRIEKEFPRWERLYRRVWETVRQDAEKAIQRRAKSRSTEKHTDIPFSLSLGLSQSLSLITTGGSSGARAFTPHHSLWRALISLFITLLTHVRLPLFIGDQICEFLAAWIARFAGPDYYFHSASNKEIPASLRSEIDSVNNAIEAMETWNADLTCFIFQQQKVQVLDITPREKARTSPMISEVYENPLETWSSPGKKLKFAALAF